MLPRAFAYCSGRATHAPRFSPRIARVLSIRPFAGFNYGKPHPGAYNIVRIYARMLREQLRFNILIDNECVIDLWIKIFIIINDWMI